MACHTLKRFLAGILLFFSAAVAQGLTVDLVTVGNAGNLPDTTGYGAVPYTYQIGKYDVTNTQYAAMLNAVATTDPYGLYVDAMGSLPSGGITRDGSPGTYGYEVKPGYENMPVVYVNWYSVLRFSNWLTNGQPTGAEDVTTTEGGAYTLTGATSVGPLPDHGSSTGNKWLLPTIDEWYKAAYHKNDGVTGNYLSQATGSNTPPTSAPPSDTANTANFCKYVALQDMENHVVYAASGYNGTDPENHLTDVGAYTASASPYGTYDQAGNVWQWNEAEFQQPGVFPSRGRLGGSWGSTVDALGASSAFLGSTTPIFGDGGTGFRVVYVPESATVMPEPGTITLLAAAGIFALLWWVRNRRRQ